MRPMAYLLIFLSCEFLILGIMVGQAFLALANVSHEPSVIQAISALIVLYLENNLAIYAKNNRLTMEDFL